MDTLDYQIIDRLQSNGRISVKKLAESLSLSPPAVAERIHKLESEGVIVGYKAVINPKKIGLNIKAIINITLSHDKQKDFLDFSHKNTNVLKCHHVTGGFSMSIDVICREMSDLEALVGEIQQYGNTQTLVILSSPIEYKNITVLSKEKGKG